MLIRDAFFAYPGDPETVGSTIERACEAIRMRTGAKSIMTWRNMEVCGDFIATKVLTSIDSHQVMIADITRLNFNVIYEIGYAIGKGRPVYIVKNSSLNVDDINLSELGMFDTLGYQNYSNSEDLTQLIIRDHDISPIALPAGRNSRQPIYIIQPRYKTDFISRTLSRLNKTKIPYRSFDPNEQNRLAAFDAIQKVAESYGIVIPLLAPEVQEARLHNLRAAFVAGLAAGMERVHVILQFDYAPVPIDYRDLVKTSYSSNDVDNFIADFAANVAGDLTSTVEVVSKTPENLIQMISLGASTSENELKDLANYYLETDPYMRVVRGEARVVVGRKGSGKTAIFYRARDRIRRDKSNVVLDLKPEGYQLRKFRDSVVHLLQRGTQEHLVMAFWEYVLYLEICAKLISDDVERHSRNPEIYELYNELVDKYGKDDFIAETDFSDRLDRLANSIIVRYSKKFGDAGNGTLSLSEITDLLYHHDLSNLRILLRGYLKHKGAVWIFFDNIDKGWPSKGIEPDDMLILRTLLEATRKIEREFSKNDKQAHTVVFLRNDVYDLLLEETADRGKETKISVDWTDADLLREIIRLRLISSEAWGDDAEGVAELDFGEVWNKVVVPFVLGEDSAQYLIDRCLMRPRALIDLINQCRSFAVNLRHARIDEADIAKGLSAFSNDLTSEINLEIRDVMPEAEDILYHFIGTARTISYDDLVALLLSEGKVEEILPSILDVLIWHGVLGLLLNDGRVQYIYDVGYNVRLFKAQLEKLKLAGLVFQINPAFWPALLGE
jgi:hypothetical protein